MLKRPSLKTLCALVLGLTLVAVMTSCESSGGDITSTPVKYDRKIMDPNIVTSGDWIQRGYLRD